MIYSTTVSETAFVPDFVSSDRMLTSSRSQGSAIVLGSGLEDIEDGDWYAWARMGHGTHDFLLHITALFSSIPLTLALDDNIIHTV